MVRSKTIGYGSLEKYLPKLSGTVNSKVKKKSNLESLPFIFVYLE